MFNPEAEDCMFPWNVDTYLPTSLHNPEVWNRQFDTT
jgi:hypothetical protein